MLGTFAAEVSGVIHQIGEMDQVSTKLASAECTADIQQSVADGAHIIYSVMEKKAAEYTPANLPEHRRMTLLVEKMAAALRKPDVPADVMHKLAAVFEAAFPACRLSARRPLVSRLCQGRGRSAVWPILQRKGKFCLPLRRRSGGAA